MSTSTEYLKERLYKKKSLEDVKKNTSTLPNDATSQLKDATEEIPDLKEQIRLRKLRRQAEKLDAEDASIEQRKIDKQEEQVAKERYESSKNISDVVSRNIDKLGDATTQLQDKASSVKTTGGISLLLVILVVIIFIVVRVNAAGDTRLKQLWYMLNGRTALQGKVTLTGSDNVGGGSSGDFGNSSGGGASGSFSDTSTSTTYSTLGYRGNTTF